jgi:hypothetical protein
VIPSLHSPLPSDRYTVRAEYWHIAVRIAQGIAQRLSRYRKWVIAALLGRGYLALMDVHNVLLYDYWNLHEPNLP